MKTESLFINGVYEETLKEISTIQSVLPEQILFLQPFSGSPITKLRDDTPTVDEPMRLFMSITTDLAAVHYIAEIVGWDDKSNLSARKRFILNRLITTLQPNEGGLYNASRTGDGQSINLLHIRRLRHIAPAFEVGHMLKTSDGMPVSDRRTTAGGFSYVRSDDFINQLLDPQHSNR